VDINGDGNIDLLSAAYTGLISIFYGNNDGSLNEAVVLKDKLNTVINLGKFFDLQRGDFITQGKWENEDKACFVKAHDWDNDGDLDLLISGYKGVKLRINEGTKTHPVFETKNIEVVPKYHADAIVDWDDDGLWDILCGSQKGGVYFYKNTGKLGSPSFGEAKCIIKPAEFINKINGGNCGITQLAVADYNNDGKLDLIIGNQNTVNKPIQEQDLTINQIKERELLQKRYDEIMTYYEDQKGENNIKKKKNLKSPEDGEMMNIYQKLNKLVLKVDIHGYVWLSLRK
jgi:hypothetical protein